MPQKVHNSCQGPNKEIRLIVPKSEGTPHHDALGWFLGKESLL